MSYRGKFEIKGLKANLLFGDSMHPVLAHHFKRITRKADKYLSKPDEASLHKLRIALRRFRYLLEAYCSFIKPARFKKIYGLAVDLQNLLGERRDLDVMLLRWRTIFATAKAPLPALVETELQGARTRFDGQIAELLPRFIADKQLRKLLGQ